MLCDEIFSPDNFLGIIIQNKLNSKNDSLDLQKNHEYILVYRKKINLIDKGDRKKIKPTLINTTIRKKTILCEGNTFFYLNDAITTRGEGGILANRNNLGYTIYYNESKHDIIPLMDYEIDKIQTDNEDEVYQTDADLVSKGYVPIRPPKVRGHLGAWTWELAKIQKDKNNLYIQKNKNGYAVKSRTFVSPDNVYEENHKYYFNKVTHDNYKSIVEFSTNDGSKQLANVLGEQGVFDNPKNVEMVKSFINLIPKKNATILDFFAGSGTTAQAVLELNQADGGHRTCILCTNNQNKICEGITYPRVKIVITGIREDGSKYSDGIPANLKYYHTDFVAKDEEFLSDALLNHIAEMIQLEHGVKLDGKEYLMVLTDEEADELASHWQDYPDLKGIYLSSNVLLTTKQEHLFKNVETYIIPDYYFDFELEEAGESW